jgi:hypothetical protein
MSQPAFRFSIHPERLAIARLEPAVALPDWVRGGFVNIARTPGELSIVCAQRNVPRQVAQERDKIALFIEGTVPMTSVGIIAALSRALADAGVPIFVIATYDTDWILVGADRLAATRAALESLGHSVRGELPAA